MASVIRCDNYLNYNMKARSIISIGDGGNDHGWHKITNKDKTFA